MKDIVMLYIRSYVDVGMEKNFCLVFKYIIDDCKWYIGLLNMLIVMDVLLEFIMINIEYEVMFRDFCVVSVDSYNVYNLMVDVINCKVVCWLVLRGKFIDGMLYDWNYFWFFDFNEDGSKIKEMYNISDMY